MHVTDINDDYLPVAEMHNGMLLCLHTTATNAYDVLRSPNNYKDIDGRPDEEKWRAACIKELNGEQYL
eukprot:4347548-Pleurochrysis_carterae.AAC.9